MRKLTLYILLLFISFNVVAQRRAQLNVQSKTTGSINAYLKYVGNFEPEYQAVLFKALEIDAVLPTIANQRLQNDIVLALKNAGLWSTHDGVFFFKQDGSPLFKKLNWKDLTLADEDGYGELVFDSTGVKGDGVNYLKTNTTYSNYTLNDASISFELVQVGASNPLISAKDNAGVDNTGNVNTRILAAATFQNFNGSNNAIIDFSNVGFYSYSRSTSTSVISSINGVQDEVESFASTIMPDEPIKLFVNGSVLGDSKLGSLLIGSNVDSNELALYNAINNAPAVTVSGGIPSTGYQPILFTGNYGTYDAPSETYTIVKDSTAIKNGLVSDQTALDNRKILTEAIRYAVEVQGAKTVQIADGLDAYFNVNHGKASREASFENSIKIEWDSITVDLGTAKLRVQPNKYFSYTLVGVWAVTGTTIKNGHLIGDRYTHSYDSLVNMTHDNGMGFVLYGGKNVVFDNIYTSKFTGDGLGIRSTASRNNDGTEVGGQFYTDGVDVINSTFTDNRRNGAAVTDGNDVVFNNCNFSYIGLSPLSGQIFGLSSNGYTPRAGVDWEAIQTLQGDGVTLNLTELITNGRMTNCKFENNYIDIDAYKVFDLEIDNNILGSSIINVASTGVNIHDNVFDRNTSESEDFAIQCNSIIRSDDSNFTTGWRIVDNTINGYHTAMQVAGNGTVVTGNTVTGFTKYGLYLLNRGENLTISNNSFTSTVAGSIALYNFSVGVVLDNVNISNSTFTGVLRSFDLYNISGVATDDLDINGCTFTGATRLQDVANTTIQNSTYSTPITESGTNSVIYINNNN